MGTALNAVWALYCLLFAFAIAAIVLLTIGENPVEILTLMATEAFGNVRRFAATLSASTPLLFTAVATAICFRSGVFNVGVDGAFVLGGLAAIFLSHSRSLRLLEWNYPVGFYRCGSNRRIVAMAARRAFGKV